MDNASKNAKDMIGSLTMQYNRGRQAAITNELVDIITGALNASLSFADCADTASISIRCKCSVKLFILGMHILTLSCRPP